MEFRNIQTFIRVAELGSFTKAAKELGYVQSAVTMQIQQLEKELDFPLFDRIGKKISLTSLGSDFLEYAYEIVCTMNEVSNLGKDTKHIHGTLRVGVLESLLFSKILHVLTKLKDTYPNMNLQLKMGQTSELLQQLKQNQLDMLYLSANLNTDPDLHCHYKREEELIFVCGSRHPIAGQKNVSINELLSYDFVVTEQSGICFGRLMELAAKHNLNLHTSIEVDSTIAIIALLQENNLLGFLPKYSVQKQLDEQSLVKIDVNIEPQIYYSQILVHKNHWVTPFMAGFIESISTITPV